MTIEKEDVFSVITNFMKIALQLISLNLDSRVFLWNIGGLQVWVNSRKSFTILSHRYNMIQYDMIWYGTLWYDMISHWFTIVKTIRLKLFLSWNEHARRILQNIHCFGFENVRLEISLAPSFPGPIQGIICRRIFSSDRNIMRMLFHISPPSLIFICKTYYSSNRTVSTFSNKKSHSHCFISMIVENHCFDKKLFVAYDHML